MRHLSVGDVATFRGRLRQLVNGTVKKDSDDYLSRYDSIQSLPTTVTQYSAMLPFSNTGCALKQQGRAATETIYATPMQPECPNNAEDVDSPPPLPPPPLEFQSTTSHSEVIPIATKVHHTYANVSEAVHAKSAGAVESSFRPGENARLSSAVGSGSQVTRPAAAKPDAISAAGHSVQDAAVGSVEVQSSSASPIYSINSNASSSSNSSLSSTSVPSPSCSAAIPLPLPSPPLPPRRAVRQASGLRMGSTVREASKKLDANVSGFHASSLREAVSLRHKAVRRDVTADQLQHDYPPHRLLNGTSQTRDGTHSMVAPLKIIQERAQVARITKRSFSVDAAAHEKAVADSDHTVSADSDSAASEDMHCGFLFLAERARQEYIKRRASVIGCEEQPSRTCTPEQPDVTTRPAAAADQRNVQDAGGEFKRMIAQKAVELQQNKAATVNKELAANCCHGETARAGNGSHKAVTNSASNGRRFLPQLDNSSADERQHNSDVLPCHYRRNGVPASMLLPGKTSFGFKSELSQLKPYSDELVILPPPPPDFADADGANPSSTGHTQSSAPLTLDHCSLDRVPSPPPEFSDSPNHDGGNFRCRPVATWSVRDVTEWLVSLQMNSHGDSFMAHAVDGHRLTALGRAELIDLGVSQVGQRMNLERAIKRAVMSVPSCNL